MAPHCCNKGSGTAAANNSEKQTRKMAENNLENSATSDVPMEAASVNGAGVNGWNHHPCKY